MTELAVDGIPVAVTCRVLKLARQPYYRWLADPVTDAEFIEAHRANALFDAHRDDPEFGYRYLGEEAQDHGPPMAERTAWRICSDNQWWSVFGKKKRGKNGKAGPPVHDDLVARDFTAPAPNMLWVKDIKEHPTAWIPSRRRQALLACDQGCVLQKDRRLLDGLQDDVAARHSGLGQRGGPPRAGRRLRVSQRQGKSISQPKIRCRPGSSPHRRLHGPCRGCRR